MWHLVQALDHHHQVQLTVKIYFHLLGSIAMRLRRAQAELIIRIQKSTEGFYVLHFALALT